MNWEFKAAEMYYVPKWLGFAGISFSSLGWVAHASVFSWFSIIYVQRALTSLPNGLSSSKRLDKE
jgi:hypothetical protein